MSDTSIVQSGSSKDDYGYEIDNNFDHRQSNCWTRIGANVCVCILTLITIFLLVALLYTLYQQNEIEKLRQSKVKKNGKNIDSAAPTGGFFNAYQGIWSDLTNGDEEESVNGDDYIE
jgi:hypothetical protein